MRTHFVTSALAVLVVATASDASAQSVGELADELDGYLTEVDDLGEKYLKPTLTESKYNLEARYNDGRIAYYRKDYQQAGSLLYAVVRDSEFRSFPNYREGVWMLGDALFKVRNYVTAAQQFDKILDEGPGDFYEESAARLLDIAYQTRSFDRLEALHSRLSGSAMGGEISYLAGKAFYDQGSFDRARDSFQQSAQKPEYRMRAEYFRAVCFVAEKNLGEAKRIFGSLVNTAGVQGDQDQQVVDLSWLALGRISYEEGDIEGAIDNYGRLARTSPHFDRSLWEQTWVLVSRGNFEEARRNVDIITYLDDPDPDILANSQLLRADLSLKLGEYDTARADYQAVLDRFGPIQREMDEFAGANQDMNAFFNSLVASGLAGDAGLPPLIGAWIQNDPEMREATANVRTMKEAEAAIGDTYRMLDELSGRLNSATRVQSFPDLADGFTRAVEIETRLLEVRQLLVDAHYGEVSGSLKGSQKKEWSALVDELDELKKKVSEIPQGRDKLASRQREVVAEFDRLRRRLDETNYELESLRAQLRGINKYLGDELRPLSKAERAEVTKGRDELAANIAAMSELQKKLSVEVELLRESVGENDPVRVAENELYRRYQAKLGEAEDFLNNVGGAAGVADAQAKIARVQRALDGFFRGLDEIAGDAVGGLASDVDAQRTLADQHRDSLQQLVTASQSGAGVAAYVNFMQARAEYTEIVLRGEVGIMDVVWQKKEDMTNKISKLFEDRTSELNLLQEAFEEVR